jgi:anaerobic selenocysteine-containing dehydrogenase
VEFDSTTLSEAGHDGLPTYREPHLSPENSPEVAAKYPLVLTSGGRSNNFTHSQGRMLETLRRREPDPRLQINPDDAQARGIEDGDRIQVSSPTGRIEVKAWVTDIMAPGVVHGFHGWAEANINSLVPDGAALDPISGYPPFKSCLCQVEKQSA